MLSLSCDGDYHGVYNSTLGDCDNVYCQECYDSLEKQIEEARAEIEELEAEVALLKQEIER